MNPIANLENSGEKPVCVIVLGMAGCGKTTLVTSVTSVGEKPYAVNLDPACRRVPFFASIDIRDTINYKEVMAKYKLGPNGAIVTSLNLFSLKFSEVEACIEKSGKQYCFIDTPGQIEVFLWSASGEIITKTLSSAFPTVILYVMDMDRNTSPITFMSNMLYACSILYKTCLPFIIVMNKIDIVSNSLAVSWMQNYELLYEALEAEEGYISNLLGSLAMKLEEFYKDLKFCGVSSVTGEGMKDLYDLIDQAKATYKYPILNEPEGAASSSSKPGISDIHLKRTDDDSGSDSEGEELNPREMEEDPKEEETFKKVVQQQKQLQVKRAQEAADRKKV